MAMDELNYIPQKTFDDDIFSKHAMKIIKNPDDMLEGWCMYFWIPQEIHMKRGKMAGQVAHASARLARMMNDVEWEYYTNYEIKIVFKVPTIEDMMRVRDELLQEYPLEFHTLVFDNTWEKHTVFGIVTKRNLRNKKWKLA